MPLGARVVWGSTRKTRKFRKIISNIIQRIRIFSETKSSSGNRHKHIISICFHEFWIWHRIRISVSQAIYNSFWWTLYVWKPKYWASNIQISRNLNSFSFSSCQKLLNFSHFFNENQIISEPNSVPNI